MAKALFSDAIDHGLAEKVRKEHDWANPRPLGLKPSLGMGDRLGVATPGHILAMREHGRPDVTAIFAQQSMREMARTRATPREVMDAATLAVYRSDYQDPWGADADHLKTVEDIKATAEAGFTFFTADPSDYVNDGAEKLSGAELEAAVEEALRDEAPEVAERLQNEGFEKKVEKVLGDVDPEERLRAIATYARAITHTERLYRAAAEAYRGDGDPDFEMSVDETFTPTTPIAHALIARELQIRNVRVTSLALRFVGEFQKGIDYIGDVVEFRAQLKPHVALAQAFGPYKVSVHSGSDKFAIYPILAEESPGLVHVKTAGTSFLEAVRVVARHDPEGMRAIVNLALDRFEEDTATYHTTTDLAKVPKPGDVDDADLESAYLGPNDPRQVIHITYGSILANAKTSKALRSVLEAHAGEYAEVLSAHFAKHMTAFPEA